MQGMVGRWQFILPTDMRLIIYCFNKIGSRALQMLERLPMDCHTSRGLFADPLHNDYNDPYITDPSTTVACTLLLRISEKGTVMMLRSKITKSALWLWAVDSIREIPMHTFFPWSQSSQFVFCKGSIRWIVGHTFQSLCTAQALFWIPIAKY